MIPEDLMYTPSHGWVRLTTALVEIGVTGPIVRKLLPLISVDLPDADDELMPELPFGELEGLYEVHQLYPPAEARIVEVNEELIWDHKKLVKDPYGAGWLLKVHVHEPRELEGLLAPETYRQYCAQQLGKAAVDD